MGLGPLEKSLDFPFSQGWSFNGGSTAGAKNIKIELEPICLKAKTNILSCRSRFRFYQGHLPFNQKFGIFGNGVNWYGDGSSIRRWKFP